MANDAQRLPDRWHSRDFPVLLAAARRLDAGERPVDAGPLGTDVDLPEDQVIQALKSLLGPYITGKPLESLGGTVGFFVTGLTERGRRAVGLWPSGEGVDALVDALHQAEDATDDEEEKTMLRRAAGAVGSVSKGIMTDVLAAVIAKQSGLG